MKLTLDFSLASAYTSLSQKARIVSEHWVADNLYCPICGNITLYQYEANKPVADFLCRECSDDFELKSKNCKTKDDFDDSTIVNGAY